MPDKFNVGTQKEWTFNAYTAALRMDFEYRGKKYWDTSNVDVMNSVKLLSARASIKHGGWEFALSGKNLLNQYYFEDFTAKTFSGLPNNIGWVAQSRAAEATVRFDFCNVSCAPDNVPCIETSQDQPPMLNFQRRRLHSLDLTCRAFRTQQPLRF